jgi:integrase
LLTRISRENCKIIVDYILAFQTEVSPKDSYRFYAIATLKKLSEFHNNKSKPSFKDIPRQDIIDCLDSYRKPETVDHLHQWIGTYNTIRICLLRFFIWFYAGDLEPSKRPKPAVMDNIPKIKRKEVSIYKPTDLWTEEDDVLFYKYYAYPRDRCWHAVARDTGCRPRELLSLKIKDVVIQQLHESGGRHIARITVNGKTGTRHVRINNAYPILKDWLSNGHPFPNIPDAALFCGIGKKGVGRRLPAHAINAMYDRYKKVLFPSLLQDSRVPEEDKRKMRDLLKKKWNPYVRRHTAATEMSKILKDPLLIDQYMGWSHKGNTRQKYQHSYNDDAFGASCPLLNLLMYKPLHATSARIKPYDA